MPNPFSNILGSENPAKKIQQEIKGMELKKQTLILSVQNEIRAAQLKVDDELRQIGSIVYDGHIDGVQIGDKLGSHFNEITSIKEFIQGREAKIKEIVARYDEELEMLNSQLTMMAPKIAAQAQAYTPSEAALQGGVVVYCDNCGKPYVPGKTAFCAECGKRIG